MYSCRLDSFRFNDTDTRRHTAECVREKNALRKTVTTTICQLNPFKRQHWYLPDPSHSRQADVMFIGSGTGTFNDSVLVFFKIQDVLKELLPGNSDLNTVLVQ